MIDISTIDNNDVIDDNVITEVQKHRLALLRGDIAVDKCTLALMDSLTITAISNKRIQTEKEANASNSEYAIAVTNAIREIAKNPFMHNDSNIDSHQIKAPNIPTVIPLDGEAD